MTSREMARYILTIDIIGNMYANLGLEMFEKNSKNIIETIAEENGYDKAMVRRCFDIYLSVQKNPPKEWEKNIEKILSNG